MLTNTILVVLLFTFITAQDDSCPNISTCGECIQNPQCIWCLNPKVNTVNCQNKENSLCESKEVANTQSNIIKNNPLSTTITESLPEYVQIAPQHIKLKIPKNQEYTIPFQFARAQNPLDLYFLMDASFTMKPYKDLISKLGNDLVDEIKKHTTDFKIGFGSFVDKALPPFDFFPGVEPDCKSTNCTRGYSFRNHLSLTTNIADFQTEVSNAETSSNIDHPEGGLEALIQAMVCTETIGWRTEATRLIVFTTDDHFHVAGDGRLVGALYPNDGKCHLVDNKYTQDKELDYPSVSFVNHVSIENGIHIVFAIARSEDGEIVQDEYEELQKNIDLSKYHALNNDSQAIIDLVVNTYKEILQTIKMSHDFDEKFNVEFSVQCPNTTIENKNYCKNIKVGDVIEFEAKITPLDCNNLIEDIRYTIKADGIDESLTIDLEVICSCDCEKNTDTTEPNATCNDNGYIKCGICSCKEGFSGKYCECSHTLASTDETYCIDTQTNTTCNDNGDCICGMCQCKDNYYGTFCKCEDGSCPRKNDQLCSGEDHGKCKCGECKCMSGWTGNDCSCPISNNSCIAPYSDGKPCSQKGNCVCGRCKCENDYFGDFCEGCIGCEWCEDLDPCVEAFLKDLDLSEAKSLRINCSTVDITPRDNATVGFYDTNWNKCLLGGKLDCNTVYRYKFDDNQVLIVIGEEICPFIASIGGLLLIILLPILLGGIIAILAWKGIVTVKDKREYANFLKKRDEEKWNTELNPLYKSAQTTYMNPLFNKTK